MKRLMRAALWLIVLGTATACGSRGEAAAEADAAAQQEQSLQVANSNTSDPVAYTKADLEAGLPRVVDFSAVWCPPCQKLKPVFESLKEEYAGRCDFITVDVDEQPELAERYRIEAVPTLIFINSEGKTVRRESGYMDRERLDDLVQQLCL